MSFDNWKTNAPDPGSGGSPVTSEQLFWKTYEKARLLRSVPAFLDAHRERGPFTPLVWEVETRLQCECGMWLPRSAGERGLCDECRQDVAMAGSRVVDVDR